MARILSDLIVKKRPDNRWELVEPLEYHVGHEHSDAVITVPKGFVTDFASTPPGVRNLFPKDGLWTPAAVIHDYLYQTKMFDRKKCDDIFLEAMQVCGVNWIQRWTMWVALRGFGRFAWAHGKP